MGLFGGLTCSKHWLFAFNVIFWIGGCTIVGVGIWLLVDPTIIRYINLIAISAKDPHIKTAAWLLIGLGVFVILVGVLGCCGAIRESKCMLGLYIFFLVVIIIGELTPGLLVWFFKQYIVYDFLLEGMQRNMRTSYGNGTSFDGSWDYTQYELECCGALTSKDYGKSVYYQTTGKIPPSCCVTNKRLTKEQAYKMTANDVKDYEKCLASVKAYIENKSKGVDNNYVHEYGCRKGIGKWFDKNGIVLLCVGSGLALFEVISVILACCVCRRIKTEAYDEYDDDT